MRRRYTIEFNIFDSWVGHINVTFRDSNGNAVTFGANQDSAGAGLIFRGNFKVREGIVKNESNRLSERHVTRSVPVTEDQFYKIFDAVSRMENQRYDYALFGTDRGPSQVCADWANDIYKATGHPGNVGDLFSYMDRFEFGAPVWSWIPGAPTITDPLFKDVYVPDYVPSDAMEGYVPDIDTFVGPGELRYWFTKDLAFAIDGIKKLFALAESLRSPLILDLDGDGIETLGHDFFIHFDHDRNSFAERTGWVAPDDGLLVLDRNGNGTIDDGSELFGNYSGGNGATSGSDMPGDNPTLVQTVMPRNGFEALAAFDSNRDGKIDAADPVFASLRVWKDSDSDGVSDEGEMLTLAEARVASLSLGYSNGTAVDAQGNSHLQLGSFTTTQGQTRQMIDVWFAVYTRRSRDLDETEAWAARANAQLTPLSEKKPLSCALC